MKYLLLTSCLLTAGTAAHAQARFSAGPQVGYTLASANYKYAFYDNSNASYRSGFAAGLTGELGLGHLLIRPAVLYAQKGVNVVQTNNANSYSDVLSHSSQIRIDYLAVPLNIGYAFRQDGQGLQFFGGAYLGFALGGVYTADVVSLSSGPPKPHIRLDVEANGSSRNVYSVRSPDFGVQGGVGYRYHALLAQAEYSVGLRDVEPDYGPSYTFPVPSYYNRVFHLSLAYLFGSQ